MTAFSSCSALDRRCHGIVKAPAKFHDAVSQDAWRQPLPTSPFRDGQSLASPGHAAIAAPIVCLLDARGPAAILRRIRSVVVDAIQCVLWPWTWAHVHEEGQERPLPASTHTDPAEPVVLVTPIRRLRTSLDHAFPTSVLRRVLHAVRDRPLARSFFSEAATRLRRSSLQVVAKDGQPGAAIALTPPTGLAARIPASKGLHRQTPEAHSRLNWVTLSAGHVHLQCACGQGPRRVFAALVRAASILPAFHPPLIGRPDGGPASKEQSEGTVQ